MQLPIKRMSVARTALTLAIVAACKTPTQKAPTAATATASRTIASTPTGPVLSGSVRGEYFEFLIVLYHAGNVSPAARKASRKRFEQAGFTLSGDGIPDAPDGPNVAILELDPKNNDGISENVLQFAERNLDEASKNILEHPKVRTLVAFKGPAKDALSSYHKALIELAEFEKSAPAVMFDDETREALTRADWAERLEGWHDDIPLVNRHVTVHAYQNGELLRLVTLGMRKFALPDISVNQVSHGDSNGMTSLINLAADALLRGAQLQANGTLVVPTAHDSDGGATKHSTGSLTMTRAKTEQGDADNALLEIAFPGPPRQLQERHVRTLSDVLGSHNETTKKIAHNRELLAESARARAKLLGMKTKFAKGAPPLESLSVKGPFPTESGGTEWMWVEVTSWTGTTLNGILQSTPNAIPSLKAGARVKVEETTLFDYIYNRADHTTEGNTTEAMMLD